MSKPEYSTYIVSLEWVTKRRRIVEQRNRECEACFSAFKLNVHHGTYKHLGRERDKDLFLLCEKCHLNIHKLYDTKKDTTKKRNKLLLGVTIRYINKHRGFALYKKGQEPWYRFKKKEDKPDIKGIRRARKAFYSKIYPERYAKPDPRIKQRKPGLIAFN